MSTQDIQVTLPDRIIYVTGTVNQLECIWTKIDGAWVTTAPRAVTDTYIIQISAVTRAGVQENFSFTLYSGLKILITDRTQSDVDNTALLSRRVGRGTASQAERESFLADLRGSYDYRAFNRVGTAVQYLTQRLNQNLGLNLNTKPRLDWTADSRPTESDHAQYLDNIKQIKNALATTESTPDPPETMAGLNYQTANHIEQILLDINQLCENAEQSWLCSGDLYSGEI